MTKLNTININGLPIKETAITDDDYVVVSSGETKKLKIKDITKDLEKRCDNLDSNLRDINSRTNVQVKNSYAYTSDFLGEYKFLEKIDNKFKLQKLDSTSSDISINNKILINERYKVYEFNITNLVKEENIFILDILEDISEYNFNSNSYIKVYVINNDTNNSSSSLSPSSISIGEYSYASGANTLAIGDYSHSEGYGCIAKNYSSHAEGYNTQASGWYSHSEGFETQSIGMYSHAEGCNSQAQGLQSHAEGYGCIAARESSHAEGHQTNAAGPYSHAEGDRCVSPGPCSHAEGYSCQATGNSSHAEGYSNAAPGEFSHVGGMNSVSIGSCSFAHGNRCTSQSDGTVTFGENSVALKKNQMVIGSYNATSYSDVFIIGNGTSSSNRSNCFSVSDTGDISAPGAFSTSRNNYSEMFEWADGNENDEDRTGYFVTFEQGTNFIRKANDKDNYIIGIVSANPSLVGDNPMDYKNKYMKDKFGRIFYDEYVNEEEIIKIPRLNENYNKDLNYTIRSNRNEWDAIGLIGKLYVYHDGTCEVGSFCKVNCDGKATKSEDSSGYYVIEKNEDVIKILFR